MTDSDYPLVVNKTLEFTDSLQKMSSVDTFGGTLRSSATTTKSVCLFFGKVCLSSGRIPMTHTQIHKYKDCFVMLYLWWNSTNSAFISDVKSIDVSFRIFGQNPYDTHTDSQVQRLFCYVVFVVEQY